MESKVSVIVPVFRVEAYLPTCVDSILGQTYRNIELILVDDGSDDGCPAMCDAYAAADARVRCIHKQNGGLSSARNAGVEVAVGDMPFLLTAMTGWIRTRSVRRLRWRTMVDWMLFCGLIRANMKRIVSRGFCLRGERVLLTRMRAVRFADGYWDLWGMN